MKKFRTAKQNSMLIKIDKRKSYQRRRWGADMANTKEANISN